jgi:hypothetical protein
MNIFKNYNFSVPNHLPGKNLLSLSEENEPPGNKNKAKILKIE